MEAEIDAHGVRTSYEIEVVWEEEHPPKGGPPPAGLGEDKGIIPAGTTTTTVHALLTGLKPGTMYWYEVIAKSEDGEARSYAQINYFYGELFPEGSGEPPYHTVASCWLIEATRVEAEKLYREAQEGRERAARQVQEREAGERLAMRQREETAAKERERASARCVVPNLRGDSLRAARRALAFAHCRLGAVRRPAHAHGAGVVARQSAAPGRTLPANAPIGVKLRRR